MSSELKGFDALIRAFTIFKKYSDTEWPTHCSHDQLTVMVDPAAVSAEDTAELAELGFHPVPEEVEGFGHFYSFRFGSA